MIQVMLSKYSLNKMFIPLVQFIDILTILYFQAENQKKYNKNFEMKYKKKLSKQAKKEYAIRKANASEFEWEDEM